MKCNIQFVGKQRNGKPKYWCVEHKSPVVVKDGIHHQECVFIESGLNIDNQGEVFHISPNEYPGGIALWGALPAVYDTTTFPMDFGIHVHARKEVGGVKQYDKTFSRVAVENQNEYVEFDSIAAVSYVFANILSLPIEYVQCPRCGYPHLDKDWFSVNPHKKHLCAGCGHEFYDNKVSIGNPIMYAKNLFGDGEVHRKIAHPHRSLVISQKDYPYGISIWGSNAALLWTSPKTEEYGIHVHAYADNSRHPTIDETYDAVNIDGVELSVEQVRTYMVQQSLPFLSSKIEALQCDYCGELIFENGHDSCNPTSQHKCQSCGAITKSRRKVVSNPFVHTIELLSKHAVNALRQIDLMKAYPTLKGW